MSAGWPAGGGHKSPAFRDELDACLDGWADLHQAVSINVRIEAKADELAAEPMSHVDLQGIRGIPGRRVQAIVSIVSVARV